jgi:hypothetical protein|eukprot:COSAG06_NODE_145_length_22208_cov_30.535664_9_plen_48_part_00
MAALPGSLQVLNFAIARAAEIEAVEGVLAARGCAADADASQLPVRCP